MLDTYNQQGEMVIYQTEDGKASVDVMLENETVWLTQKQMALLFDKDQSVIARHIANVFEEGELDKAIESGFVIMENGSVTHGKEKWISFYEKVTAGETAEIRLGYYLHSI